MFTQLSISTHLNDKLEIFVALAPIVNLKNCEQSMLVDVSNEWRFVQYQAKLLKVYEIRDPKVDKTLRGFCNIFGPICDAISALFELKSPYTDDTAW